MQNIMKNRQRILALDVTRGLCVLLMVCVHTLWMYGTLETQSSSWVGIVLHLLGKGTAAFLVLMGISLIFSRDQSLFAGLKRGVFLLLTGYLLNTFKFIIPTFLFGTTPESFIEAYGWHSPLNFGQYLYLLLTGDILQLAGCSMILIALLRHWTTNKYSYLTAALLFIVLSKELSGIRMGVGGIDYILDLLWGARFNVYFPVFPWISCILFGMFMGTYLMEIEFNHRLWFKRIALMGVAMVLIGTSLMYTNLSYHFNDFFHIGPGGILYLLGLNAIGLWAIFIWTENSGTSRLFSVFIYCSQRVTSMYFIQWTLICWGMGIIGYQTLSSVQVLAMLPVTLLSTFVTQYLLDEIKKLWSQKRWVGAVNKVS